MDSNFISVPSHFIHMEGNSVNFSKSFDLNGTDNDEMLRLYLRKAGLSDEIECLAPEQRRAFIYDIIKSNKLPGYWLPSTMKTNLVMHPVIRPPPLPMSMETSLTRVESPTTVLNYATMSTSSSSSSLKSMGKNSPIMPHRFVQPSKSPPSPSTFITGKKGRKYEISGPANFVHVSGDMTRDMTRNAFDLTLTMNDNVLKKYLMERGIKEEHIYGMRKQDLIKNIVQSQYTWVPPKSRQSIKKEVKRMNTTIDDEDQPLTLTQSTSLALPSLKSPQNTGLFSNYALVNDRFAEPSYTPSTPSPIQNRDPFLSYAMINSRFADPSEFPSPNSLNNTLHAPDIIAVNLLALPHQAVRPAPPPRNSKFIENKVQAPPPPPSTIKATVNISPDVYHSSLGFESNESITEQTLTPVTTSVSKTVEDLYATPKLFVKPLKFAPVDQSSSKLIPLVPKSKLTMNKETSPSYYKPVQSNSNKRSLAAAPPPPPPPPPPPMQESNTIPRAASPPMQAAKAVSDAPSPLPPAPPPIPPPMQILNTVSGSPIPPPAPLMQTSKSVSGIPLPPPMTKLNKNISPALDKSTANEGDAKDDFLESIRKGIILKKVDTKAATISGIKPRAERKPPVTDFLSELRMGITLRRAKNSADNPLSENDADESNA